jgi:predicted ATPase/class 3 adenylate cyclase
MLWVLPVAVKVVANSFGIGHQFIQDSSLCALMEHSADQAKQESREGEYLTGVKIFRRGGDIASPCYSRLEHKEDAQQMAELPTGTVTFLFTDVEGSTKLWERYPQEMGANMARHDELLRTVMESSGGFVFKTIGDAFCVAFSSAPHALEAALGAQRALLSEEREKSWPLRTRMALHTGSAEERGGDYFGPPLNRIARLLSAGHGGQILLSSATKELVRDGLPEGASLRDLGERRLKDLFRPERVFQLISPELPATYPPLNTLEARINNLPAQPTPLIGRERELGEVGDLLREEEVRLLTLTGAGGIGKTRLGLQVGAELLDEFEDGVFFVVLAPITDPALVPSAIAEALGVVEAADQPLEEALKDYLRTKELLVLLDNFEQVLGGAPLLGKLLSACPRLKVLATSRSVLRVYGEQEYPVPPLELPRPGGRLPAIDKLSQYEAVRLFIERAKAARAEFSVTDENAPAVAEICARLDGLPLAIELAAARIKLLTPAAMLERLGSRLKLLRGGARDLPERQRTLRGTIEWSFALLEEGEQALFGRLAVFSGGRTLEAIEAICDAEGDMPIDALEGVSSLLDKSLLRQEEGPEGEPRFVMLETIHEFAREKLQASGEAEEARRLHAEYFLAVAEEAEPELSGTEQLAYLERLEAEHDNMRAALSWSLEKEPEAALRLAVALARFWEKRSYFSEGSGWLGAALSLSESVEAATTDSATRAKLLSEAGTFAFFRTDFDHAIVLHGEALELYRQVGDDSGVAFALLCLGAQYMEKGDHERAAPFLEEALAISRRIGDKQNTAGTLHNLAEVARQRGEYERAKTLGTESMVLAREMEDKWQLAVVVGWMGLLAVWSGEDHNLAQGFLKEALALDRELGNWAYGAYCLEGFAGLAGARGQGARAARLWGAAEALRTNIGAPLPPDARLLYEPSMATVRAQLGEAAWEAALAQGMAMSSEEAAEYALGEGDHA